MLASLKGDNSDVPLTTPTGNILVGFESLDRPPTSGLMEVPARMMQGLTVKEVIQFFLMEDPTNVRHGRVPTKLVPGAIDWLVEDDDEEGAQAIRSESAQSLVQSYGWDLIDYYHEEWYELREWTEEWIEHNMCEHHFHVSGTIPLNKQGEIQHDEIELDTYDEMWCCNCDSYFSYHDFF